MEEDWKDGSCAGSGYSRETEFGFRKDLGSCQNVKFILSTCLLFESTKNSIAHFTFDTKESIAMIRILLLSTLLIGISFIAHEGFAEDYALILGGAGGR